MNKFTLIPFIFLDRATSKFMPIQDLAELQSITIQPPETLSLVPTKTVGTPHEGFNNRPKTENINATQVYHVKNGTLHGVYACPSTAKGYYIDLYDRPPHSRYAPFPTEGAQHILQRHRKRRHLTAAIPLVSDSSHGYFHWLMEELTRIPALTAFQQTHKMTVTPIIPYQDFPWMRESLRLLGYDNPLVWDGIPTQVEHLILPNYRRQKGITSLYAVNWLRERLLDAAAPNFQEAPYIYISRQKASKRRIVNEEAILSHLIPLGFQRFELETLTFTQQISLFAQAKVIIAPHGAGLANVIFAPTSAKVIEIFAPSYINRCYHVLITGRGMSYGYLIGEDRGEDIWIDPKHILALYQRL